ncbi:MAG: hypothetical protein EYC70_06665 [Planctomycetota bacterium]|nr:MAG: hypothetical protein EYC70_06665 [Planctomycetota bacterium]
MAAAALVPGLLAALTPSCRSPERSAGGLEWIAVSADRSGFVRAASGTPFVAWGFNYDHDRSGRLLEDYWQAEWPAIEQDFREMRALGANVVRIHLQAGRFLKSAESTDTAALAQLRRMLALAEETGLYLDITGLGCYHKHEVPAWYDALDEAGRWAAQARFWEAVASTCAGSPAVFCYDLMNEPILPGAGEVATDWLAGDFAGKHFVQRISLDLAGRTREQVAAAWVDTLVAAIRRHDARHLITVGVIPWALVFPGAQPIFYAPEPGRNLDFASVHFYPKKGEVDRALDALAVYDVGKPLVVEEIFPLECSVEELDAFVDGAAGRADGWIGFYWGQTREELAAQDDIAAAIIRGWLEYFAAKAPEMREPPR